MPLFEKTHIKKKNLPLRRRLGLAAFVVVVLAGGGGVVFEEVLLHVLLELGGLGGVGEHEVRQGEVELVLEGLAGGAFFHFGVAFGGGGGLTLRIDGGPPAEQAGGEGDGGGQQRGGVGGDDAVHDAEVVVDVVVGAGVEDVPSAGEGLLHFGGFGAEGGFEGDLDALGAFPQVFPVEVFGGLARFACAEFGDVFVEAGLDDAVGGGDAGDAPVVDTRRVVFLEVFEGVCGEGAEFGKADAFVVEGVFEEAGELAHGSEGLSEFGFYGGSVRGVKEVITIPCYSTVVLCHDFCEVDFL